MMTDTIEKTETPTSYDGDESSWYVLGPENQKLDGPFKTKAAALKKREADYPGKVGVKVVKRLDAEMPKPEAKKPEQPKPEAKKPATAKPERAAPFTSVVDAALIKGGSIEEILAEIEKSDHPKPPAIGVKASLKAQIAHRKRTGFAFEEDGDRIKMLPKDH